jgi:hypothetical protein
MIETTLGALTIAGEPLARLTMLRLPAASAYHIARLARLVDVEVKAVQEQRNAAIKELGAPRPATEAERAAGTEPEVVEVTAANRALFNDRMIELAAVPTTIPANRVQLTFAALNGCTITAADLLALDPFVEVVEELPK